MIGAPDHYVRLAAHEHGNLRRVDAVNQPRALLIRPEAEPTALKAKYTSLMYRVFIVARGYPLGEILRQLGGGPPDPLRNVRKELLQFQSLAQPVYFRWTSVQQAILNLNRFVFRLAISAPLPSTPEPTKPDDDQAAHPTQGSDLQHQGNPNSPAKAPDRHAEDTLGFIADPDVWRIFLMHHWEFVDDVDAAPDALPEKYRVTGRPKQDEQKMITDVSQHVRETWYPNLVIPDDWQTSDEGVKTFNDAQEYCRTHLSHLVEAWDRMCETVNACRAYNERKSKLADKRRRDATVARRKAYPDEWYAALLHNHPIFKPNNKERNYPKRWLALQREAYLVSKPFEPGNRFTRLVTFRSFRMSGAKLLRRPLPLFRRDIPHDPRVLEPFVMRTYYYLVDLNHLTTDADDPAPAESQPPLETE